MCTVGATAATLGSIDLDVLDGQVVGIQVFELRIALGVPDWLTSWGCYFQAKAGKVESLTLTAKRFDCGNVPGYIDAIKYMAVRDDI